MHITGESAEHYIFLYIRNGFNLKKLVFENVFEGCISFTSDLPHNIESISFINVKELRNDVIEHIENIKEISIKQCKFYSLPETEANAVYHITNSVFPIKINDKWCDVGITNFVGTREQFIQFIQTYKNSTY